MPWWPGGGAVRPERTDNTETSQRVATVTRPRRWRFQATGPFSPLTSPQFRLLSIATILSATALSVQALARAWYLQDTTHSPFIVSVAGGLTGLPVLVFGFLGGQLSDQFSRKKVLLACEASMMVGAAVLSWMMFSGAATTGWVLGFSAVHGLGTALSVSARQTLTADSAPPGQERGAIGLGILVANLSGIIGPTLAGNVIGSGGIALAMAMSVGFGAAALPFYGRMALDRRDQASRPSGNRWRSIGEGVRHAVRDPLLRWLMLTSFITLVMLSSRGAVYPAIVEDVLHLGAGAFALIEVTGGIGATLGPLAAVALSTKFSERRVELWSGLVFAVTVMLMALSNSLWMAALMSGLTTFVGTIFFAANLSGIQLGAPPALRGRVLAARFALSGTYPMGMVALGGVAEFIGPQWALGAFAVAGFAMFALASALWMPRGDAKVG